jgi:hypothetical protein
MNIDERNQMCASDIPFEKIGLITDFLNFDIPWKMLCQVLLSYVFPE